MIARLRVGFVAFVLVAMTLTLWPLQAVAMRRGWPLRKRLPHLWHVVACFVAGVKVTVSGEPAAGRPLLIVSNHQSWSDIMVLGKVMPLCFIAKAEVETWPAFGLLARLQRTVFVEREARGRTGRHASEVATRLSEGDAMVLFAEGTTSDGNEVLPFRTALFGAAQMALRDSASKSVLVQPVAVAYTRANGLPLGRYHRPLAAWPGNVELSPHLLDFLREGAIDATVAFGEPILFTETSDRKAVARQSEASVRRLLAVALRARD
ncbi:lysophospholipid acyltransferase family protein [Jiella sonneratiae]|uniref:1-acyl-sn-glycerol-3-phosphate acyltransferase n=1 Tax=Jiella sonneratiae TaxID=2816856 RepID=A0ABS3J1X7_9HYPH|nr:lysophospholipid acyltransferase family protein [Jiella sonneratiae]MBO0903691.1 1-acyl-sn-glycerol-3-phosphate acyltransferase [Jiella sonneratiae]